MTRPNYLSLFSGIGGLDLGLDRAGMSCVGQVEIDPFCRRVLSKHWPEVPKHDDVRTATEWWQREPRPTVHVVCGGFPCQPVSDAGAQCAQEDARWLWPEMASVIAHVRPDWIIAENVKGLLSRGFGDVLGDLAALGYDAEWDCIPAASVGAPHRRDRVFIVAYPQSNGRGEGRPGGSDDDAAHRSGFAAEELAHTDGVRREGRDRIFRYPPGWWQPSSGDRWPAEPGVGRMAHGVPFQVDRLRALGNAVVPQVGEHIGRLIMASLV